MARQFEHPILISSCVVNVIALTSISTVSRGFASAAGLEKSGAAAVSMGDDWKADFGTVQ
jgi:hypothetical protein